MTRRKAFPLAAASILAITTAASGIQDNWSYTGRTGPDAWGAMEPACAAGMQSPIAIEGTEPVIMHRLETLYQVAPIALHNTARTVEQKYPAGSALRVGPKIYLLEEFHFHTPAEHRILDNSYPMEIQFTHRSPTGEMAIVSVLVKEGRQNAAAEELLPNMPVEPGQTMSLPNIKINARDFMPLEKDYFRYMGSLSHPPCTPGVNWYVLKNPIEFSADQIALVKSIVGENARPIQKRDNRIILDAQSQ